MITEAIIILISVLVGWFLRDLKVKVIKEKAEKIVLRILPKKSAVVEWNPPKTEEETAEEGARKNIKTAKE